MWDMCTHWSVLGVVALCGVLKTSVCESRKQEEYSPCPSGFKRGLYGDCRPEEQHPEYTEYYIWIGIISGLVVLLGVALLSCICCKCCLIYKRRVALENARAGNNGAVTTISSLPQIGHGAHGPVANQFRFPQNSSLPRIENGQYQLSSLGSADSAGGEYVPPPFHVRYSDTDPRLPMYSHTTIPVFPDEPPPRYTP